MRRFDHKKNHTSSFLRRQEPIDFDRLSQSWQSRA